MGIAYTVARKAESENTWVVYETSTRTTVESTDLVGFFAAVASNPTAGRFPARRPELGGNVHGSAERLERLVKFAAKGIVAVRAIKEVN